MATAQDILSALTADSNKRYYINDFPCPLKVPNPKALFLECVHKIIRECPPTTDFPKFHDQQFLGLFCGPTTIAYLFLWISKLHPELEFEGKSSTEWAAAYLDLGQDKAEDMPDCAGFINEYHAYRAIRGALTKDMAMIEDLTTALSNLKIPPIMCEWLQGRGGSLLLLRIVRHFVPEAGRLVDPVITLLIDHILAQPQPWMHYNKHYYGTGHGDMGNITQIVLSDPARAPEVEQRLALLLDLQDAAGNWPANEATAEYESRDLVQFCHGAPGFAISLASIGKYFSAALQTRIVEVLAKARACTWKRGLLTKEPNLCHGITGNALALEGEQREHFLALATPEMIARGVQSGVYTAESEKWGLIWGEAGRAWVWMSMMDGEDRGFIMYNEV